MIQRQLAQLTATVLTNAHFKGFLTGKIYDGPLKRVCVPTLNCYSCPGALFSCPVGAAQVIFSGGGGLDPTAIHTYQDKLWNVMTGTPLFVIGTLFFIGALIGRAACGWACPFGFLQDLIHKLPTPKFRAPKAMRLLKYAFLIGMVVSMPLLVTDSFGFGEPTYCKYVCPAGTLEGGIPLPLLNPDLRAILGKLFAWKVFVLISFLTAMVFIPRPFCSWACPIGAFLAPFNRASFLRIELDAEKCVHCGACSRVCVTGLDVETEIDGLDCVRCLECAKPCPKHLIEFSGFASSSRLPAGAITGSHPNLHGL